MSTPELRTDPITGRRVIVAPQRSERPFDDPSDDASTCPFCSGRESETPEEVFAIRDPGSPANGPDWHVRVVPNRFPAVYPMSGDAGEFPPAHGIHEVVLEAPGHVSDFASLSEQHIGKVLRTWRERLRVHRRNSSLRYVMVFKNSGLRAGASLEHVHSQIIGLPFVPDVIRAETPSEGCRFCELLRDERNGPRWIGELGGFAAVCPVAPRFGYETWVIPTLHRRTFSELGDADIAPVAAWSKRLLTRLGEVADRPDYNLVLHDAPTAEGADFHWHIEILPRVNEAAGFEWGTGVHINPVSPERAAGEFRSN